MSTVLAAPSRVAAPTAVRTVRIALAGCGTVGSHLVRLLREHGHEIEAARGLRFEIVRVLVRDVRRPRAGVPPHALTSDVDAFLATPADVVVEALGGLDPAARVAGHALATGRALVTANKALVAAHGSELRTLARGGGVSFSFEAAVAGGVPVLRVLRDAIVGSDVSAVRGILNGTTNYILSRMEAGDAFGTALADAQHRGFAEADPARDLNGRDAADKLAILAWLAFGTSPSQVHVATHGLLPDPDALVGAARAAGATVRLVAEAVRTPLGLSAAVEPTIVAGNSHFARAAAEENLVEVETGWCGTLRFTGPGAGGGATASAILGDLLQPAPPLAREHAAPRTAPDPRPHRWLLACTHTTGHASARREVVAAACAAGVDVLDIVQGRSSDRVLLLTAPTTRAVAAAACDALRSDDVDVLRLRWLL